MRIHTLTHGTQIHVHLEQKHQNKIYYRNLYKTKKHKTLSQNIHCFRVIYFDIDFSVHSILISIVFDLNFCLGEYGNGILHTFCLTFSNEVQYIIILLVKTRRSFQIPNLRMYLNLESMT